MFKPSRGLWHLKQILAPNEWIHKSVGYSVKGQMCVMATRKLNLSQITIHHQALPKKLYVCRRYQNKRYLGFRFVLGQIIIWISLCIITIAKTRRQNFPSLKPASRKMPFSLNQRFPNILLHQLPVEGRSSTSS